MANTEIAYGSNQAVNIWSKFMAREMLKRARLFNKFRGTSEGSIIYQMKDLEKFAGDVIKYDLLMQFNGSAIINDNWAKGNGEALQFYQDSLTIGQKRFPHEFTLMSQQRTLHNLRMAAKLNIADRFAKELEDDFFRNVCGDTTWDFGQAAVAPDTDHYITCGDVSHTGTIATDEASLGTNDQFDMMDIDYAKELAKTSTPPVRDLNLDGDEYYVIVLHPFSITDMRTSANSSATIKWNEIQQYANKRGLSNPIFDGSHGVYNKCVIHESQYIYSPISNVRRNVLLGAQAAAFALGNPYSKLGQKTAGKKNMMSWFEDSDDYGNWRGILGGMVYGMKACRYNSKHYGAVIMTAYAKNHKVA